jgi:polyisoprenyl-teichoic acid--peptidoglycan teichoic acid transferase
MFYRSEKLIMDRNSQKVKRRKKLFLKRLVRVLGIFFLGIITYFGYVVYNAYDAASQSYEELDRGEKSKLREKAVDIDKDPFSILIMGVEDYSSGGEHGRTDSLIVATLDPEKKSVKLISIPRDTLVEIPGKYEKDKINHAYAFGGKDATIESVENLLKIPIDYYVTIGFDGFKDIIDEIGGVNVEVPFDFTEKSDVDNRILHFYEGQMDLNGEEALAYARMRKMDPRGDFGRNDRQKQIISATVEKLLSPVLLNKTDEIAQHVGENIQTNMKVSEALAFSKVYAGFKSSSIDKLSIEGYDQYIEGIYYFVPDEVELEKMQEKLQNFIEFKT